jgi:hypothetical protein
VENLTAASGERGRYHDERERPDRQATAPGYVGGADLTSLGTSAISRVV